MSTQPPESRRFFDNTQVSAHRDCARFYYYRHVEHLRPEGEDAASLVFGLSWHAAMDSVWPALCGASTTPDTLEVARPAMQNFLKVWQAGGMAPQSAISDDRGLQAKYKFRRPDVALEMLVNYIESRKSILGSDFELISAEQPFAVPLYPDRTDLWYCGRMDKIVRHQGHIWVVDHKTTSLYKRDGGFRNDFLESFSPNSQIDGYCYAAHLLYPGEFSGALIDGALVHENIHDAFCLLPSRRPISQLDGWLWQTRARVDAILADERRLGTLHLEELPYLEAFEQNTGNCFRYGAMCMFADFCKGFSNPLRELRTHGTPLGFKVEPWSPFDVNKIKELGL